MTRLLSALFAVPLLWCQAEGRYYYASIALKGAAGVRSGTVTVSKQSGARFSIDNPAAPGQTLPLAASTSGAVLAGSPAAGTPLLFVAVRAGDAVALGAGEWSAVMISLEGAKPRGLRTAFLDFAVSPAGELSKAAVVSHEAGVDDLCRAESIDLKAAGKASLEILGINHALAIAAAGDMFIATSSAPANPSLVIGLRRDRDATTMALRGSYALAEIGARNSFSFAPDRARFFSTMGVLEAMGGQARVSQRVTLADSAVQFRGAAAYMVSAGGGTFSPRLDQRRRNLAVAGDVFITAQVAEAGQLSLLHGIGIGLRVVEMIPPVLAAQATAQGDVVSLYGRNLEGVQVRIGGQPATIAQAWPNQINVKATAPLNVELDWQGGRTAAVSVAITATTPEFAAAPAVPGGLIVPAVAGAPGDTIELGITGAAPPAGFSLLFDGVPGQVVSSALAAGATRVKVTLPKNLTPAMQVNVALAAPGHYVDLGDIAVSRPVK
jgi:hypothetical protein